MNSLAIKFELKILYKNCKNGHFNAKNTHFYFERTRFRYSNIFRFESDAEIEIFFFEIEMSVKTENNKKTRSLK